MTRQEIEEALDQLAATAAQESIGSIDHAANAKAIALRDETVREKLAEVLSDGYKLKAIAALTGYGASPMDFRLKFHFESEATIDLPIKDFIASVELPTKSVKRILSKPEEMRSPTVGAPFSVAVPSRAPEYRTPTSEIAAKRSSERRFIGSLSLGGTVSRLRQEGFSVQPLDPCDTYYDTVTDTHSETSLQTNVSTTTYCNGIADDEQNDLQADWVDDVAQDVSSDYKWDCI